MRVSAVLAIGTAFASGACLYQRPPEATQRPMSSVSPPQPWPPDAGAPPALDLDAAPDDSTRSRGPLDSDGGSEESDASDGFDGSDGSTATTVRQTWFTPTDPVVSSPPATPPLLGDIIQLPIVGHPDVVVSLPTGAIGPRPVVVVIHGAGDRPDRQCRGWRNLTQAYPFIVCPTGRASPRYTHIGGAPLLEYIDRTLDAVKARYPEYVDTTAPLLAGFSLGAKQATDLAVHHPARFPRLALVEGATTVWTTARVSAFLQGGGQRVLFGCGQDGVHNTAERTAKRLTRLGLNVRVVFAEVGHKFAPRLQEAVRSELAWLMDGDARWPAGAPSATP